MRRELRDTKFARVLLNDVPNDFLRDLRSPDYPFPTATKTLAPEHPGQGGELFSQRIRTVIGYLRDGRFEIDNNLVENSIRPTAVGRRRWLFIGHPQAGWRSAVIYSILLSCRRRGINPQNYLTDVLGRLPSTKITQIQELLPAYWKPPSANTS